MFSPYPLIIRLISGWYHVHLGFLFPVLNHSWLIHARKFLFIESVKMFKNVCPKVQIAWHENLRWHSERLVNFTDYPSECQINE